MNNLKQIALACHNYHDVNAALPNGGSNTTGWKTWCWAFQILPYIEQQNLYNQATMSGNYLAVPIKTYLDPGRPHTPYATKGGNSPGINGPHSDYAINCTTFQNNWTFKLSMSVITAQKGTSNVILVGEKAMSPSLYNNTHSNSWDEDIYSGGYGGTSRSGTIICQDRIGDPYGNDWGAPYAGGCPFVMADGSVHMVNYSLSGTANMAAAMNYLSNSPLGID